MAAARTMPGLDYVRSVLLAGGLPPPPIAAMMEFSGMEVEEGRILARAEPGEHHLNPMGMVHGGFAATVLDSAMGCAVQTTLPAGTVVSTVDLSISFVRPISPGGGPVLCEGSVLHRGRNVATARAGLTRESDDRLLAHGTATCLILPAGESN